MKKRAVADCFSAQNLRSFVIMTLGTLATSVGIYFFKFPNHFSTGGVTGIAVILNGLFPAVSSGLFVAIINVALLILGLCTLGKGFTFKTVYCSLLLSFSLTALEWILPLDASVTGDAMLDLCFSVLLPAIGSAFLFNVSASTGGTDIVAMLLKKHTSMQIGTALFCVDFLIAVSNAFVFGIATGLYSLLGLLAKALVVDQVIESINLSKYFFVVTKEEEKVCAFIREDLKRGATVWASRGAYTHDERSVVLTVLNRAQAIRLRRFVKEADPSSFVIISNTSEIIGKGFREI